MYQLTYIPATPDRLNEIFSIFQDAINSMISNGINQWDEIYPDISVIEDDISKGQMTMVLHENQIAAIYVVNEEFDPQYANGKWNDPDSSFRVVHRLCVNPLFQNKGVAGSVMQDIENTLQPYFKNI